MRRTTEELTTVNLRETISDNSGATVSDLIFICYLHNLSFISVCLLQRNVFSMILDGTVRIKSNNNRIIEISHQSSLNGK